jgi:hypothetical protein
MVVTPRVLQPQQPGGVQPGPASGQLLASPEVSAEGKVTFRLQQYNVSRQRTDRAIAGLSMGGAEATLIGLNHLNRFHSIVQGSDSQRLTGARPDWTMSATGSALRAALALNSD